MEKNDDQSIHAWTLFSCRSHRCRIVALREGVGAGMLEMAGKALEKLSVDTGAVAEFSVLDWWSLLHFNSR